MNFASYEFAFFFIAVFGLYWHLSHKWQNRFLLLASLFFYACWDWRFLTLIIISIVSNYYCGLFIARNESHKARKSWLAISLLINLGLLAYFKYAGFFVSSALSLADTLGWHISQVTLEITLPVGISFYIFQSISYSLDIYRKQLTPEHKLLDFATFVAFFPQLVAGPIVRAKEFLFQLETQRIFSIKLFENGVLWFLTGFFKKTVIADNLAIYLVDPVFSDPTSYSSGTLWLAMVGYAVQIYADFSGYSNMAIGCALMLGFKLPENFRYPYLAINFSDFWQRWHITMSRFFRDYVYIALGGNRCSQARNLINLATTTLVSGLWHGASWTFVAWGGLHGIYIAFNHMLRNLFGHIQLPKAASIINLLAMWFCTQLLVCFAWVLFRSPDFSTAYQYLLSMLAYKPAGEQTISLTLTLYACFIAFIIDHIYGYIKEKGGALSIQQALIYKPLLIVSLIIIIFHGKPEGSNPFIYFQF